MHFFSMVLRNVLRRRMRSSLTTIGLAVAVASVVALFGVSQGLTKSWLHLYDRDGISLIIHQSGPSQSSAGSLPLSLADKIFRLQGVKEVHPGIVDMIVLDDDPNQRLLVNAWPPDSKLLKRLSDKITQGRNLSADDLRQEVRHGDRAEYQGEGRAVIGQRLADSQQKGVGDSLSIFGQPFRIVGIFEDPNLMMSTGMVILLKEMQRLTNRADTVTGFTVAVKDPGDGALVERVGKEIEALGKGILATPSEQYINSTTEMKFLGVVAWVTSAIAIVIGAVGVLNTMVMSVFERTREIGILRAIGWRKRRIVRMILVEAVILSIIGGVVGIGLAIALTGMISAMPAVGGTVEAHIAPWVMLLGMGVAVGVGLLGAAYPAFRGARLVPTEALRHE